MVLTNDPAAALEFCAQATRLGLGLEVTAEGAGRYALATRDIDEGVALWHILADGIAPGRIDHALLQLWIDSMEGRALAAMEAR